MLVGAGEEVDPAPLHPAEPGDEIGRDGGVGVPQMGHVIHVVDRGGQVEDPVAHGPEINQLTKEYRLLECWGCKLLRLKADLSA